MENIKILWLSDWVDDNESSRAAKRAGEEKLVEVDSIIGSPKRNTMWGIRRQIKFFTLALR